MPTSIVVALVAIGGALGATGAAAAVVGGIVAGAVIGGVAAAITNKPVLKGVLIGGIIGGLAGWGGALAFPEALGAGTSTAVAGGAQALTTGLPTLAEGATTAPTALSSAGGTGGISLAGGSTAGDIAGISGTGLSVAPEASALSSTAGTTTGKGLLAGLTTGEKMMAGGLAVQGIGGAYGSKTQADMVKADRDFARSSRVTTVNPRSSALSSVDSWRIPQSYTPAAQFLVNASATPTAAAPSVAANTGMVATPVTQNLNKFQGVTV